MKKIAINTVKNYLKENKEAGSFTKEFPLGECSFAVEFHTGLTTAEKSTFIRRVLSGCFDMSGDFRPEYVEAMFHATVLQMCTNLPTLTLKSEETEDGDAVMDLDSMDALYKALDLDSLDDDRYQIMASQMRYFCAEAIAWKKTKAAHPFGEVGVALRNMLLGITDKVNEADMSNLVQYAGALSKATEGLDGTAILDALINKMQDQDGK